MDTLKTLKDLDLCKDCTLPNWHKRCITQESLKAAAINWIKANNGEADAYFEIGVSDPWAGTVEWIKHFFNLTEEDLK